MSINPHIKLKDLIRDKKSIQDTRLIAFNKLIKTKKLSKRRKEVAEALLLSLIPMTSAMLEQWCSKQSRFKHLMRCTITGRFNELVKAGVIREYETKSCLVTGSTAKFYTVIEVL